jgi:peptide/nickel transport system substrate-binding protein
MRLKLSQVMLNKALATLLTGAFLLAGCSGSGISLTGPTATPTPEPTATAVPIKTLVICLGQEPSSLYLYGDSSQSAWSIFESLYDGPIDTVNYEPLPVILENIPTEENGGVTLQPVSVSEGDIVANTEGDLVALKQGVKVFPEGCTSADCAVEWDGTSELKVPQMVVKFKIKSGVNWSDGQPVTAEDSVYSYTVANDPATNASKTMSRKTASYTAQDAQTVVWMGVPGYLTQNPSAFFWIPLPKHVLSTYSAEELNSVEAATQKPIGWGPYMVDEWQKGDHIRMVKNPNYFRASEGLPKYDVVVYRFLGNVQSADITPVMTGECDVIDTSVSMEDQASSIRDLEMKGKLKAYFAEGPEWEGINFGIKPASYDDVFNPYLDRTDFFGDVRTRQAIASCINRDEIVHSNLYGKSTIPTTYLAPNHPFFVSDLTTYAFDPARGEELLDEAGWKDTDNDPTTPRVAVGVANVQDDTPFTITYSATDSPLHSKIAEQVKSDLGQCGIGVTVNLLSTGDMYAAAPAGVIFGRAFDLAELGWTTGRIPPCYLYTTDEIPTEANGWLGTKHGGLNLTGYSNAAYDQACTNLISAGVDKAAALTANADALKILAEEVPVLPLFYHLKVMVSRPDLCGLTLDASARSGLANIEALDTSSQCSQ